MITFLGRVIVVILNIVFILLSLCLIAGGAIAYLASNVPLIKSLEDQIKDKLKDLSTSVGETDTSSIDGFSITEFLGGLAMALIISGCILLMLSFFGCSGACCKFRTMIFLYGLIVSVLLLVQVLVVILMYAAPDTIQGQIKSGLKESLKNYKGIGSSDASDASTLGWMFVMQEMDCCGVEGYTDFNSTNTDDWRKPGTVTVALDAPYVCCSNATDIACARLPDLEINEKGCFDAVWDVVLGNPMWAGIGYSAAFVFQLLLIIFSILIYTDGKKKNNKVYPKA